MRASFSFASLAFPAACLLDTPMRLLLLSAALLLAACSAVPPVDPPAREPTPLELYDQAMAAQNANRGDSALALLTRAATGGCAPAQHELGLWRYLGINQRRDAMAAAGWFEKAAIQGVVESQLMLGQMYLFGSGIAPSGRLALKWFTAAANQGNVEAQYRVGLAHDEGIGTPVDTVEAARWLRKAAEQDHLDAMYHLGVLIAEDSPASELSQKEAADWFQRAAGMGHGPSQLAFGDCFAKGSGRVQDAKQAREWFAKAAKSENPKVAAEAKKRM